MSSLSMLRQIALSLKVFRQKMPATIKDVTMAYLEISGVALMRPFHISPDRPNSYVCDFTSTSNRDKTDLYAGGLLRTRAKKPRNPAPSTYC